MKHQAQHDKMLADINAHFEGLFRADPELTEIRFASTRELARSLHKAGISLWIYMDKGVARKLNLSCQTGGPVRGYRNKQEWIFSRNDYL